MVRLDVKEKNSHETNRRLREMIKTESNIEVIHPHSMHNFGTALKGNATITVHGSTGFYTGGFLEGPRLIIEGNTGWYTGDNISAGEIIVQMNSGSNCGPSMVGGTIVVKGNSGSRAGYGMKGGTLMVCGNVGRWAGQMTLGGRIILLGQVGEGLGESMYNGVIHVLDPDAEAKLGGNVKLVPIGDDEKREVESLFKKYGIERDVEGFKSVVPKIYGRHEYRLFKPTHERKSEHV